MKILLIDNCCEGHHKQYMSALSNINGLDTILIVPKYISDLSSIKQYVINIDVEKKNVLGYIKFIQFITRVASLENVDVVHFLSIDPLVKYFGILIGRLKRKYKVIMTFHHFRYSRLRTIARRQLFRSCTYGVVHTNSLKEIAEREGISNCIHIEYPSFKTNYCEKSKAKSYYCIPEDGIPVLGAIGGTRHNKGLDILLTALNEVMRPFYLLVAGKPEYFDEEYIMNATRTYSNRIKLKLCYLTDEEIDMAIVASDIIVLPYRRNFDGASGPLVEGVILGKAIVGANHGSLGKIVLENNLGYTFKSEDAENLSLVLDNALSNAWIVDEKYKNYQNKLDLNYFLSKYNSLYQD